MPFDEKKKPILVRHTEGRHCDYAVAQGVTGTGLVYGFAQGFAGVVYWEPTGQVRTSTSYLTERYDISEEEYDRAVAYFEEEE